MLNIWGMLRQPSYSRTEEATAGFLPSAYLTCNSLVVKLCQFFCNSMICSPPYFSVHPISQARILEWVAISFSRGSFGPRDWIHVLLHGQVGSLPLSHQRSLIATPLFDFFFFKVNKNDLCSASPCLKSKGHIIQWSKSERKTPI